MSEGQDINTILCYREKRTIGPGETISCGGKTYKIAAKNDKLTIPVKTHVEIRETLNGERFIWYKREKYPLEEVEKPNRQNPPQKEKASHARSPHKPAADHPWREYNKPSKRVPQRA
ncbi:hypothetical protein [Thermicanus aegyptius]|uniref:hypothetical protein n=1 Tax=Thermicanus aegyptius TaxID=94009 RepID=UPI00048B2943|nr:hypothetical protein [Thermicanus aegyptius]